MEIWTNTSYSQSWLRIGQLDLVGNQWYLVETKISVTHSKTVSTPP